MTNHLEQEQENAMKVGKPMKLSALCAFCLVMGGGVAAFAGEPPSTYELYQNVYNKDGSSPLVDAKWWKDESGDIGAVGDAL